MSQRLLFIALFGFTGGVALRSFVDIGFAFSLFLFLLGCALFFFYLAQKQKSVLFVSVAVFSVALGVLRFDVADMKQGDPMLDRFVGGSVKVEGVISDEPDERENSTHLTVDLENIDVGGDVADISSRGLIIADLYPKWEYGDRVAIEGKLARPKNFTNNETGKEFDYISYLGKDGIVYQLFRPKITLLAKGEGNIVKEILFALKNEFLERVSRVIPEPHASLLGGLVVGAKRSLGEKLLEDFRAVGIVHIVVLSGYNITIVAEALMRFFSFLPRVASLWVGAGSIVLFAVMTGAGATIVRASIMALLVILARATGRTYEITRALFIAGFLMVLHNPKILVFDISFQLSFLATLGLLYLPPLLEKYFHFVPTRFQLREFALSTVATQIFVLPLLLYKMGQLSIVALPVNMLVLMFVPLTMLFGFLAGVVGFASAILSLPFAFLAYGLLAYELKVVELFSALPFASVQIEHFSLWMMLALYALYALLVVVLNKKKRKIETF